MIDMKRLKLRKWVKVVITIILIIIGLLIYSKTGTWGELVQTNQSYLGKLIFSWTWLFFGQTSLLGKVWEVF